jgi:hypothetical protein
MASGEWAMGGYRLQVPNIKYQVPNTKFQIIAILGKVESSRESLCLTEI